MIWVTVNFKGQERKTVLRKEMSELLSKRQAVFRPRHVIVYCMIGRPQSTLSWPVLPTIWHHFRIFIPRYIWHELTYRNWMAFGRFNLENREVSRFLNGFRWPFCLEVSDFVSRLVSETGSELSGPTRRMWEPLASDKQRKSWRWCEIRTRFVLLM